MRLPVSAFLAAALLLAAVLFAPFAAAAAGKGKTVKRAPASASSSYSMADFARVRKFDAHVHLNVDDLAFLQQAKADGFELLTINVDYPDFPPIAKQHDIALAQAKADPSRLHWAATFSMKGFPTPRWVEATNASLRQHVGQGALAVKIWKNVGMAERDAAGKLVMLDNPGLTPVVDEIQALGVPLIGHQGEPHNCWLPLAEMTNDNDREYFKQHPQYHMFLHPEEPSYEDQMRVRDHFLSMHPDLRFVGAHMGSMEWNIDMLAKFLDTHPKAVVDLAARMTAVQYQSVRDHAKVRDFFIKYQNRLLYATDLTYNADAKPADFRREARDFWRSDWRYLATGGSQQVKPLRANVRGLALPRGVIDKLYYSNAKREFVRKQ